MQLLKKLKLGKILCTLALLGTFLIPSLIPIASAAVLDILPDNQKEEVKKINPLHKNQTGNLKDISKKEDGKKIVKSLADEALKITNYVIYFIALFAVIWVGAEMTLRDKEHAEKAKERIGYVIGGVITLLIIPSLIRGIYGSVGSDAKLSGPDIGSVQGEILGVTTFLLSFVGIIATIVLIYAGYLWLTAGLDDGQSKQAKDIITWTVISLIIIISAYVLVSTFFQPTKLVAPSISSALFSSGNMLS